MFLLKNVAVSCSLPMVVVGNKTDLHREREITYEEGKRLADEWGALFLETSAKRNEVSSILIDIWQLALTSVSWYQLSSMLAYLLSMRNYALTGSAVYRSYVLDLNRQSFNSCPISVPIICPYIQLKYSLINFLPFRK